MSTFTVAEVSETLQTAVEAGYITEQQSAQLGGLFIAVSMLKPARPSSPEETS